MLFTAKTVFEKTLFLSIWFKLTVVERLQDFNANQILEFICVEIRKESGKKVSCSMADAQWRMRRYYIARSLAH